MDRLYCSALFSFACVALIAAANSQLVWKQAVTDLEMKTDTLRNRLDSLESNLRTRNNTNNTLTAVEGCPSRFLWSWADSCYYFSTESVQKTWKQATQDCRYKDPNAYLVEIQTGGENTYLKQQSDLVGGIDEWIGLSNYITEDNRYQWYHSQDYLNAWDFMDWAPGEPNNQYTENCISLSSTRKYQWNDLSCERSIGYICEVAKK